MRNINLKVVISVLSFMVIIMIAIRIINPINENNIEETTKYNIEKKLEELSLKKTEDYLEYLIEISKKIEPKELQKLVIIDNNRAARYKNSYFQQQEDGKQVLLKLTAASYRELLCRVIRRGEDWSELPLTEHFREKFNESEGVILEKDYIYYDDLYTYVGQYRYNERRFSVSVESEEKGDYRKWYRFVLDKDGYLDDIIFEYDEIIPWDPPYEDAYIDE